MINNKEKGKEIMTKAAEFARETMLANIGGPFGAAIVKDGEVIAISSNRVLADHDPTAHAEVTCIREAGKKLGTHDLSGCVLYATGYPCPMCLSAIIWANIKEVYYCNTVEEAEDIGFRDDMIYDFLESGENDDNLIKIDRIEVPEGKKLYLEYKGHVIY